jgi:hypothetical protein
MLRDEIQDLRQVAQPPTQAVQLIDENDVHVPRSNVDQSPNAGAVCT